MLVDIFDDKPPRLREVASRGYLESERRENRIQIGRQEVFK
jgi:hypothetical protein